MVDLLRALHVLHGSDQSRSVSRTPGKKVRLGHAVLRLLHLWRSGSHHSWQAVEDWIEQYQDLRESYFKPAELFEKMKRHMHESNQWPSLLIAVGTACYLGIQLTFLQEHSRALASFHSQCAKKPWYRTTDYHFENGMCDFVKRQMILYNPQAKEKFERHVHQALRLDTYEQKVRLPLPKAIPSS